MGLRSCGHGGPVKAFSAEYQFNSYTRCDESILLFCTADNK